MNFPTSSRASKTASRVVNRKTRARLSLPFLFSACLPCHHEIVTTFQQTAHYQTSRWASAGTIRGSFEPGRNRVKTRDPKVWFEMERRPDGFYQTAHNGERVRSERFDVVIGSGRRGQTYLYRRDRLLYQLPISWLRASDSWINSPGYRDGEVDFNRLIAPECLNCHTTSFQPGIQCERCHTGPHGTVNRSIDLCAQCHSGLHDSVDVHGNQDGLLKRSKCYSSAMTCTTCHNPHRKERDAAALSAKCQTCHTPKQCERGPVCVDCHMPLQKSKKIVIQNAAETFAQPYRTHTIAVYR
jgi:hypothetical protein